MSSASDLLEAVNVDLTLSADDAPSCMLCDGEAVMNGILTVPCGCDQPLCLPHYEKELPRWRPGDQRSCYIHPPEDGVFVRWEKIR